MQQQLLFQSLGLFWLLLALPVRSFSRGAGHSACRDLRPGHIRAHPQDPLKSHVTLRTSSSAYLPGQLVTVTVRSSRDFMGFLLQARRVDGSREMTSDGAKIAPTSEGPVVVGGSWALVPPGTHTLRCLSEGDTLTHSDKQLKRNLSFVWKAPNEPIGDIRFYITVVQSYFVYWAGIQSEVVKDKGRALWRRSETPVKDGLSSAFNHTVTPDLGLNTTQNGVLASIITEGPSMSPQNKHFSVTATRDQQISSALTSAPPRHENQTTSSLPEKTTILRSHQRDKETKKTYRVTKDSNTGISYTTVTRTASPPTSSFSALQEKLRDDFWGLNNNTDFDKNDKRQNPDTAWNHRDDTTPSTSQNPTHASQYETSSFSHSSTLQVFEQESANNETPSQSYTPRAPGELDMTSLRTRAQTSADLSTIVHGSTNSSTNPPKYSMSTSSSQTGTVLSPTQVLRSNQSTAQAVTAKSPLHSNQASSSLGLLLQPQTATTPYERLLRRNPFQTDQSKSDTADRVQRPSPMPKLQTFSTEIIDSTWRQAQSFLAPTLPPTKDTGVEHDLPFQTEQLHAFNLTSESLDVAVETSFLSTSALTSPPLKTSQYSTADISEPPPPSPIPMPPISSSGHQKRYSTLAPSSRPVNASSPPASLLPLFMTSSSTTSSASLTRVISSSSLIRSSSSPFISSSPPSRVIWRATASSLPFGPSVPSTHSTSAHLGPSPALRQALNHPSQTQRDSDSATQTPEVHLNPKPHPNLNPKFNVKIESSVRPNAPKTDNKVPPKPFETPDTGGIYPDIIPRHTSWEVGMLLGCSVGLGMMLVFGVRYMYRQACGKRTEVTLNDRERRYATGERGLIHVQECGDLVRVRRLRENSFVLLAEYDILASTGD